MLTIADELVSACNCLIVGGMIVLACAIRRLHTRFHDFCYKFIIIVSLIYITYYLPGMQYIAIVVFQSHHAVYIFQKVLEILLICMYDNKSFPS